MCYVLELAKRYSEPQWLCTLMLLESLLWLGLTFFLNGHTVSVSVNSGEHLSQTFDMTRILKYLDRIIFDPLHSSDMTKIFGLSLRGQV